MPELKSLTPFPNFRYYSRDNENREFGIVIVKGTYEIRNDGALIAAEEQAPMLFTDKCHGEVNLSSLWHPSDLVPYKPATDIIVNAVARTPRAEPARSWECGLSVERNGDVLLSKKLRVTGPRWWRPVWKRPLRDEELTNWRDHLRLFDRWELSEPDLIDELPLRYEYAFGGEVETDLDDEGNRTFDTNHYNPIGIGKIDRNYSDHTKWVVAPQIESIEDPVKDAYKSYTPVNFGPIPPAWLPRRPLGGTYDDHWLEKVWPAWPSDYSFSYHNSAAPGMTITPFLIGGEQIKLEGMEHSGVSALRLPEQQMLATFSNEAGQGGTVQMNLDTVFIDIASKRDKDHRVYMTWRTTFPPDQFETITLEMNVL